jgi:hypothetical protein
VSGFSRTLEPDRMLLRVTWVGVAAARIRSSGAGRALRCRDGPRDARTLPSLFGLARYPEASRAVRRSASAASARLRAAATVTRHEFAYQYVVSGFSRAVTQYLV